jgi:hypothetical protein
MHLSFDIEKPRQTLERQWTYLVQRGQDNSLLLLKKCFIGLLLTTLLFGLFYFFTAVNDFIPFKGIVIVMISLAWCTVPLFYLTHVLSRAKGKKRLTQFLNSITDNQLSYSVTIDEEKVTITSVDYVYDIPWTEFNAFGIFQETLYVFNTVAGTNSLYWDRSEMGGEAFSSLVEMLKQKSIKQTF